MTKQYESRQVNGNVDLRQSQSIARRTLRDLKSGKKTLVYVHSSIFVTAKHGRLDGKNTQTQGDREDNSSLLC